jgi:hypothetical protein
MDFTKSKITDIYDELIAERDSAFPEYTTKDKSDFGVMLMWLFAVLHKFFADWVNRLFKNMFITTAVDRKYIIENAIERGYRPRGVFSSRQLIRITTNAAITIPKGTKLQTESGIIFETIEATSSPSGGGDVYVYAIQGERKTESFELTGSMNQRLVLSEYPFVEGSISVTIDDGITMKEYVHIQNLVFASNTDMVFVCYADEIGRGNILFGNGLSGAIPPPNSIAYVSYLVGKGGSGNVENDTITSLVNSLAGVTNVTNIRVSNSKTSQPYNVGDSFITLQDTISFLPSGFAYVGGVPFSYLTKSQNTLNSVSGLDFPLEAGQTISIAQTEVVDGRNLETDEEIRVSAIMSARMNNRIVSGEDYASFVHAHPSIAWAKYFVENGVVHVLAMAVDTAPLTVPLKNYLIAEIDKIAIPTTRYFIEDPTKIPIDIAIEIETPIGVPYESDEIISTEPLLYKGAYNNVVKAITDYLSPLHNHAGIGTVITLRAFDIYKILSALPDKQIKNSKVLSFGKSIPEEQTINLDGDVITINTGAWKPLEAGDIIKIIGSVQGNNKYVKVVEVLQETVIKVNYTFVNEDNVFFYYASNKDIQISGTQVPSLGAILVINATKPIWYSGSQQGIAYPDFVIDGGIK